MNTKQKIISWGFVVSLLSFMWAIFQWWDSGQAGAEESVWQEEQSKLISTLIDEIKITRNEIVKLKTISNQQLESTEYSNKVSENIATLLKADSGERAEVAESIEDPDKGKIKRDINSEIERVTNNIEPIVNPAIGKEGWIYIGKFHNDGSLNSGYTSTIEIDGNTNIHIGETLNIATSAGFNDHYPVFPRYEKGLSRIFPHSLNQGTTVIVLDVVNDVGLRNFTWAKVRVSSVQ